jgi:hypothetical protein
MSSLSATVLRRIAGNEIDSKRAGLPTRPTKSSPQSRPQKMISPREPSYPNDQSASIYVWLGACKRRAVAIKAASRNAAEVMQSA